MDLANRRPSKHHVRKFEAGDRRVDLPSAPMLRWRHGSPADGARRRGGGGRLGGCATRPSGPVPKPAPPPAAAPAAPTQPAQAQKPLPPPKPAPDPIVALIAESQARFETGQRELAVGHLERARREFDAAIDVLVLSPYGARYDARLREQFDRLIDRISAYEMTALAEGDGFTEKQYEPASIDALLAESTFTSRRRLGEDRGDRRLRPRAHAARHPDPAQRARAGLRRAVPGTPARVVPDRPRSGARTTSR